MEKRISTQVWQVVINYLAKQPYMEVAELLQILTNLPDVKQEETIEKKSK
jgi:hypothetical protein